MSMQRNSFSRRSHSKWYTRGSLWSSVRRAKNTSFSRKFMSLTVTPGSCPCRRPRPMKQRTMNSLRILVCHPFHGFSGESTSIICQRRSCATSSSVLRPCALLRPVLAGIRVVKPESTAKGAHSISRSEFGEEEGRWVEQWHTDADIDRQRKSFTRLENRGLTVQRSAIYLHFQNVSHLRHDTGWRKM